MILIPKARYRVPPPFRRLPSSYLPLLYVTVNFVFSRRYPPFLSLFSIRDYHFVRLLAPRSGQAAYFSFLREPEGRRDAGGGEMSRRDGTAVRKYFTVSCSGV